MLSDPKPKKNKELTKRRLIDTVGKLLESQDFDNLGVNQIAKQAHVHKKLIYRYFGKVDYLIEAYISEKDFWLKLDGEQKPVGAEKTNVLEADSFSSLIKKNFEELYSESELQNLSLWQLNVDSPMMQSIARATEYVILKYGRMAAPEPADNDLRFRAMIAILFGGIQYCILKSKNNGGAFMGLDLGDQSTREEFKRVIDQIVTVAYRKS